MSDSRSQANKQSLSQSQDLASLRKSNRPKKPSLLYADGFEDTQKVIGRKVNTKGGRSSGKAINDNNSTSEKEMDPRMEEEITERGGGLSERLDHSPHQTSDDDDEYLRFTVPEDFEDSFGEKYGYVTFKFQTSEEGRSAQRAGAASDYQMRKNKKKPAYHEDYAYGIDTKKPKEKVKPSVQIPPQALKKSKVATKPASAAPATDFLDIVLSAAIAAQANQATSSDYPGPKSPRGNHSVGPNSYLPPGKISAPKFSLNDDKPGSVAKKQKASVKKTEPSKPSYPQNDEFYQRTLEYKDHYIKEAVIEGNVVTLKHTKNPPISMPYKKQKFDLRQKELLNSKIFNGIGEKKDVKTETAIEEEGEGAEQQSENNVNSGNQINSEEYNNWRKELKEKEAALALRFKEVLKSYKPSILV